MLAFSRDHAESAASPLLSGALLSARDAIAGFWDGSKTVPASPEALQEKLDTDSDYLLDGIRAPYRALITLSMLRGLVSVAGTNGSAELQIAGKSISKIERPKPEYFEQDLKWVRAYADLRGDRLGEIHMQLNDLLSFFGALHYLDNGRRQHTLMLLDITRSLAIHVETPMKYFCRAPRPVDYAPEVQPMIQTPDHSSYPSGHAMESFAVATVLHRLQSGHDAQTGIKDRAHPFRLAHRIATNRTVAGVHFPLDSLAGAWVGCQVGEIVYALASGEKIALKNFELPSLKTARKDDEHGVFTRTEDFTLASLEWKTEVGKTPFKKLDPLEHIWKRAVSEWPCAQVKGSNGGAKAAKKP